MNRYRSIPGRLFAIALILLLPVACNQNPLPDVPPFEQLGFADALTVVRQQVLSAYEALQQQPTDASRNGRVAMLLSSYGKNSASKVFYQRARMLAPEEFRWSHYLATAYAQSGEYAEAARMFREALLIEPDNIEARLQLAGVLLQINAIEESVALYRQITVDAPKRVEGWLGLGKSLERTGDLAGAAEALQRALIFGPQYGEIHYALAMVLNATGDNKGAAREMATYENTAHNTIHTVDPLIRDIIRLNVSDGPYMTKADYQLGRGEFGQAISLFRTALAINPANQDAWGGLVYALAERGDIDATGDSYRAALRAGISYRRLHFTYGQALRKWQQFDAAREVIGNAIELDPQYTDALTAMGELEQQRGDHAAAAEQYRRALAVVPNDRRIQLSLAQALNAAEEFDAAVVQLESLTTDPAYNNALTLKELAVAYRGMQRNKDALDTLQRSREAASKAYDSAMIVTIDALLAKWRSN